MLELCNTEGTTVRILEGHKWSISTWCQEGYGVRQIGQKLMFLHGVQYFKSCIQKVMDKYKATGTVTDCQGHQLMVEEAWFGDGQQG